MFKRLVSSLIAAIIYAAIDLSGSALLGQPALNSFFQTLAAGFITAAMVSYVVEWLNLDAKNSALLVWLGLFAVHLLNLVEYAFFSTHTLEEQVAPAAVLAVKDAAIALTLALAINSGGKKTRIGRALSGYFRAKPLHSWAARYLALSVLFIVVYLFFGALFSPYISPYYDNPDLGLQLTMPEPNVIFSLEFFRALVYLAAFTPLIASLHGDRFKTYATLMSLLYVAGGLASLLEAPSWPLGLRLAHGAELLLDSAVWSLAITFTLTGKNKGNR